MCCNHLIHTGLAVPLSFSRLLFWLRKQTAPQHRSLFWGITFNIAFTIDRSEVLDIASEDPLDAPILVGPKGKARKVSSAMRFKVADMASRGEVFKSCNAVMKGMALLGKRFGLGTKGANKWVDPLCFQYLHAVQELFHFQRVLVPVFSVGWDATRMSKTEMLAATIFNLWVNKAAWCPPQVPRCQVVHRHEEMPHR